MSEASRLRELTEAGLLHANPAAVVSPLFTGGGEFFLAADKVQVKYEMLRAHFVDGHAVTATCAAFGYSRQTFYILRARLARRGIAGLRDGRPGRVGPVKCTPEVVDFLHAQRAADPTLSIPALIEGLVQQCGVRLHRRTVERLIGRHVGKKNSPRR